MLITFSSFFVCVKLYYKEFWKTYNIFEIFIHLTFVVNTNYKIHNYFSYKWTNYLKILNNFLKDKKRFLSRGEF